MSVHLANLSQLPHGVMRNGSLLNHPISGTGHMCKITTTAMGARLAPTHSLNMLSDHRMLDVRAKTVIRMSHIHGRAHGTPSLDPDNEITARSVSVMTIH